MLMRNGIGITIMNMPYRKKKCLAIYFADKNEYVKFATFNNDKSAEIFQEIIETQFMKGLIKEEQNDF